jgi:hypothetical protein
MTVVKPATLKRNAARLLATAKRAETGAVSASKVEFHAIGQYVLRGILSHLGVEGEVRSCGGGPAVLGEVVLHADAVYVQLCVTGFGDGPSFLYRTCRGRNDYVGGANRWWPYERLAQDPTEFVEVLKSLTPTRA